MSSPYHLIAVTLSSMSLAGALGVPTGVGGSTESIPAIPVPSVTVRTAPRTPPRTATEVVAEMTLRQQVGQLFMVGTPAGSPDPATLTQISRRHVGSIMLTGRSHTGSRTPARVVDAMQARATAAATDRVDLLVATDQEGGLVQVLQGLGRMPSALEQGRWPPSRLRDRAARWASRLRAAGVTMDLAPVADTVPAGLGAGNPPIGGYDRELGHRARVVSRHARAFAKGLADHGVVATVKHFPGLGRVHANTDTSAGVTDRVTTRHDSYLAPFADAVDDGVPAVLMSTAYYSRLDARHPAAFSPYVIHTMLRGDLGFRGVVVSDDLANARQVSRWTYGERAVRFLRAGGDLVLTVSPRTVPAMYRAVLTRALHRPAFRARVEASARRVLRLKQDHGLL